MSAMAWSRLTGLIAISVLLSTANPSAATETKLGSGLKFKSEDKNFSAQIGGRIMQDWAFVKADDDAKEQLGASSVDGTEFRRARLFMSGLLYGNIGFKSQLDFAGGGVSMKDMYIELKDLPFGSLRVGNHYEPFGLEELTSSKYITFMERGFVTTFTPGRNMGVSAHNGFSDGKGTWGAGIFRTDQASGVDGKSTEFAAYAQSARVTFAPKMEDGGTKVIHVGASARHQTLPGGTIGYSVRPTVHLAGKPLSTGSFLAEKVVTVDVEAALVHGPASVQVELASATHSAPDSDASGRGTETAAPEPAYMAFSAEASYWLTGEHRSYKKGNFGRVKPNRNYKSGEGKGAWQLAARVSVIDLEDDDLDAGKMTDLTLGVNWHLNPNTRVMVNFGMASPERTDAAGDVAEGAISSLQTRFQIDF